jgi:uncharacterized phage-associated protein
MPVSFEYDFDRALAATVYIASRNLRNLDKYKLCKLIFLADKSHLVRYSRPITGDFFCAMEYGPVPSDTLNILNDLLSGTIDQRVQRLMDCLEVDRSYRFPHFRSKKKLDFENYLSPSDIQVLDEIVRLHGEKTFDELKALTHEMPAYRKAWSERYSNNPRMAYEDLFAEDGEAMQGAYEEMIENDELRQAFGTPKQL